MDRKLDLEKLVVALADKDIVGINFTSCVQDALRKQDIAVYDGKLVSISKDCIEKLKEQ